MIVGVLFGVLLVHLITDFIRGRWRAWQRRKQLLGNTTVVYQRMENGHRLGEEPRCASGEESECEETTLLIRDQSKQEEHRSVVYILYSAKILWRGYWHEKDNLQRYHMIVLGLIRLFSLCQTRLS